ncbi:hypothetical protein I350_03126 [Cryptococcus amylolentus CBS 6273]|uniref:Uncharacterized protein n=1 Tax=Cryptococcus amylolentus CBS 6273 TaxID=1296118 RepID=A0A1E3K9K2_9TREE|nr:hypothetical protein I350_03126 [Cryptococcus amylolentus CBS 6273]
MAGLAGGASMYLDMMPTQLIDEHVDVLEQQIENMVAFCFSVIANWYETNLSTLNPGRIVFTNLCTFRSKRGYVHFGGPSDRLPGAIYKAQSQIRQRVRAALEKGAPVKVGMEDLIHVRGYEECRFCSKFFHRNLKGLNDSEEDEKAMRRSWQALDDRRESRQQKEKTGSSV